MRSSESDNGALYESIRGGLERSMSRSANSLLDDVSSAFYIRTNPRHFRPTARPWQLAACRDRSESGCNA